MEGPYIVRRLARSPAAPRPEYRTGVFQHETSLKTEAEVGNEIRRREISNRDTARYPGLFKSRRSDESTARTRLRTPQPGAVLRRGVAFSWVRGRLARNGPKARDCPCGRDARAPRRHSIGLTDP